MDYDDASRLVLTVKGKRSEAIAESQKQSTLWPRRQMIGSYVIAISRSAIRESPDVLVQYLMVCGTEFPKYPTLLHGYQISKIDLLQRRQLKSFINSWATNLNFGTTGSIFNFDIEAGFVIVVTLVHGSLLAIFWKDLLFRYQACLFWILDNSGSRWNYGEDHHRTSGERNLFLSQS